MEFKEYWYKQRLVGESAVITPALVNALGEVSERAWNAAKADGLAEIERLRGAIKQLQFLVDEQAEDDGLWFIAETASEAYLQQELRKLHAAVENGTKDAKALEDRPTGISLGK